MSFLQTLGHDLKIVAQAALTAEPIAAAVVGTFNPGAALIMNGIAGHLTSLITSAEQATSEAKQGDLKSQTVVQGFESGVQIAQDIYRQTTGKADAVLSYDSTKLQAAINAQVAAFNAIAELKATIKAQ